MYSITKMSAFLELGSIQHDNHACKVLLTSPLIFVHLLTAECCFQALQGPRQAARVLSFLTDSYSLTGPDSRQRQQALELGFESLMAHGTVLPDSAHPTFDQSVGIWIAGQQIFFALGQVGSQTQ